MHIYIYMQILYIYMYYLIIYPDVSMLSRAIKLGACILQTFTGMVNATWSTKKCTPSCECVWKWDILPQMAIKKWGKLWLTLGFRDTIFSPIPSTGPLFSLTDGHILALKKTVWGVLRYYPWGLLHKNIPIFCCFSSPISAFSHICWWYTSITISPLAFSHKISQ